MGKVILQRPKTHSGQTEGQFKTHKATTGRNVQSLSLQERQANYDEVRQRIFGETEVSDHSFADMLFLFARGYLYIGNYGRR